MVSRIYPSFAKLTRLAVGPILHGGITEAPMHRIAILLLAVSTTASAAEPATDLNALRRAYLDDIFVLRS